MCGIAGIWDRSNAPLSDGAILRMRDSLAHRGPDAMSEYVQGPVAFAHTRLSIIDLSSGGAQPFVSPDGRYVLVFNGEIYNYQELREKYFSHEVFVSDSDTEVLLKMLVKFQEKALPFLRGMFAFAFYDTQEQTMLLSTDPFGKKPLFYSWVDGVFLFASEPKALFASGYIVPALADLVVGKYLLHEYVPAPESGFRGVYTLGAGQYMYISSGSEKITTWWRPNSEVHTSISFDDAKNRFDELLGRAVERRMVADVPVGLFLSGGLDSSTIAWYMRSVRKEGEIYSCSVSFAEHSFNEEPIAAKVASMLSLSHKSIQFTKEEFLHSLRDVVPLMDVPLADISLLPTYAVSALARKYMKVVLDGDGSDELLGGYGTFPAYELADKLSAVPSFLWEVLEKALHGLLPVSYSYFSLDFKVKAFLRGIAYPSDRNLQIWLGSFTEKETDLLLLPSYKKMHAQFFDAVDSAVPRAVTNLFDRASLYHIATYLHRDILVKLDRATMAVGLEARTPFLDADLAEFISTLPPKYKKNKRLLRELMKGRLPDEVIDRKKQGFGIPSASWFANDLLPLVSAVLSQDRIREVGVFDYSYVEKLISEHAYKKYDHRKKIWTLIVFQLWYEYWILGKRDIV